MKLQKAHSDLLWVLACVLVYCVLAIQFELSERIGSFSQGYEPIQLDELPWALLVLSLGLAWYSWRRSQDANLEIQERIRSEAKVQELLTHNSDLAQRLFTAQEDERRLLARDLHDEMGQTCAAIRTEAAVLSGGKLSPTEVLACAQRIANSAQQVSEMTRHMLQRLRPLALDSMGLTEAIQALCNQWQENSGVVCTFVSDSLPIEMDDYVNVTLYRLVQEGLTNVARHAKASLVKVSIQCPQPGELRLTIKDNGIGMLEAQASHAGFGLLGMRERVASLGGHLQLTSALGQGLTITARLPLGVAS